MSILKGFTRRSANNNSTERNLDLASTQNRIAEEKARELKSMSAHPYSSIFYSNDRSALNKSMFAMHVSNPFTANSRKQERDNKM
jgi:hypothetical protein